MQIPVASKEAKIHFDHFLQETLPLPSPVSHCCALQHNVDMQPLWGFLGN